MEKKECKNSAEQAAPRTDGVKGFLIVECCACSMEKAFFVKKELTRYECTCGQRTKLRDLVPVYMHCECGRSFRYMTNIDKLQFTVNCVHCETPVEVELGKSGREYVTMGHEYPQRRKRK